MPRQKRPTPPQQGHPLDGRGSAVWVVVVTGNRPKGWSWKGRDDPYPNSSSGQGGQGERTFPWLGALGRELHAKVTILAVTGLLPLPDEPLTFFTGNFTFCYYLHVFWIENGHLEAVKFIYKRKSELMKYS